ncbi:MAG: lipase family protein [Thermoanaerobaculales bacterium]|jgi:triacylglycerol lipase|nr:lipase family protein [Thermoanaerobaculales bacterium]
MRFKLKIQRFSQRLFIISAVAASVWAGVLIPCSGASSVAATFDPASRSFSLENAAFLVSVVEIASQNDEGCIRAQLAPLGFRAARLIKSKVLHCVVAEGDGYVVLAFRGSTTMQDWLTDLKFAQAGTKTTGLPGKVHRGFVRALDEGWPRIAELLHRADENGASVWITGHSLGGGLSHIAAMRAAREGIDVAGVYTFASPRVGNDEFAEAYEEVYRGRSYRVVNIEDMVPHVPPSQAGEKEFERIVAPKQKKLGLRLASKGVFMMVKYTHTGELFVFGRQGVYRGRQTYSDRDDARFWREVEATYGSGSWAALVNDQGKVARTHFLDAYVKVLHQAVH